MNADARFIVRLGGDAEPLDVGKCLADVIIHKGAELLPYAFAPRRLCHAKRLEDDGARARRGEHDEDGHMIKTFQALARLGRTAAMMRGGSDDKYNEHTGNCRRRDQQCPRLKAARLHRRRQTRP
jgi:hypothetical protein